MRRKDNWIPILEFTELFGKSKATIHSQAFHHRKNYNKDPEWYKHDGKMVLINVSYFTYAASLKSECRKYATSPTDGIYWYLMNYITESELARKMSVYSYKYKSERSWVEFFNKALWLRHDNDIKIVTKMERGQLEEFIIYGSFILHSLAKRLGVREHES
jgi:hypothetical protein